MVTVTLRHRDGMPLKDLHGALMRAWRRCHQGGAAYWLSARKIRKLQRTRWGLRKLRRCLHRGQYRNPARGLQSIWAVYITASVRAVEMPHGENGWHPHLHVLLRTEEWDEEDRAILLVRWKEAIRRELGDKCTPNDEHALVWSDPIDASDPRGREKYLTKLGLEVAGPGKTGKKGSDRFELARRAYRGDQRALRLWEEFYRGTRGRRMLELDERAAAAGRARLLADADEKVRSEESDVPPNRVSIEVTRDTVRSLRRLESGIPTAFAMLLALGEEEGRGSVETWLAYARERFPVYERILVSPCPSEDAQPWQASTSPPTSSNVSRTWRSPLGKRRFVATQSG